MDLSKPVKMTQGDRSGTPVALLELVRRDGGLALLPEGISPDAVLVEFPMGDFLPRQVGFRRFVALRRGVLPGQATHALVEGFDPGEARLPQDGGQGVSNHERALRQAERLAARRAAAS